MGARVSTELGSHMARTCDCAILIARIHSTCPLDSKYMRYFSWYIQLGTFIYSGLSARLCAVCSCSIRSTLAVVLFDLQRFTSAILHQIAYVNDSRGRCSARMQSTCQIHSAEQVRLVPFSAVVEIVFVSLEQSNDVIRYIFQFRI